MNRSLVKVVHDLLKRPSYAFAKPQKQRNYDYRSPKPIVKQQPEEKPLFDLQKIDVTADTHVRQLFIANMTMVAVIPLWMPINVALVLLNGGFIISQTGHQLKHFLLLVNNNRLDQLNQFPKPSNFVKFILIDATLLSVISTLLAYNCYSSSLLLTGAWYGYKIVTQHFSEKYLLLGVPLFMGIFINAFLNYIQKQIAAANDVGIQETSLQK